jgi:hypothetical protein
MPSLDPTQGGGGTPASDNSLRVLVDPHGVSVLQVNFLAVLATYPSHFGFSFLSHGPNPPKVVQKARACLYTFLLVWSGMVT